MCAGSSIDVHYKSVNTANAFTDLEEVPCENLGDTVIFAVYSSFRELHYIHAGTKFTETARFNS